MAVQEGTGVRNARLDQIETTVGTAPLFRIYTGTQPADCATAASGTKLVEIACPSDWLAAASGGSKTKSGTWSVAAAATGTAGYWRVYDTPGTTCHMQGSIATSGADLTIDNTSITIGQTVTVSSFTLTEANA